MHVSSMSLLPSCSWLAIVLISLLLISRQGTVAADGQPPSKPIVTPITRDPSTSLYTIPVKNGVPLVLDLAGSLVWSTCQQGHRTIPCKSSACKVANRNRPASCSSAANGGEPGNTDPHCACTAYPSNPVSGHCGNGDLTVVPVAANATDGKNPLFSVSFNAMGSCAPDGLLESLPSGAAGVAGLSRLPLSLPSQVASKLKVAKQFALCLPSDGQTGAAIFGGGPFQLMENWPTPTDLAEELRRGSLPLVKNPKNKGAYYFRVHGIAVNEELVPLAPGALDLDARSGRGGAVFSTVTPYTTLRSDIFNALVAAFERATSGVPRRKPPPPPNNQLCFEASGFSWSFLGPDVPIIDLMLDNQRNWSLPAASSLVQVSRDTLCFAFQNMGSPASEAPDAPAIIFGTHQMVDNLVQLDLEKNMFGFSGLFDGRRTQCGRFDFSMGSS